MQLEKIQNTKLELVLNIIDSISFLNEDTVAISFNKNLVIYNSGNTVNISKGNQVNIANTIHLNPSIDLKDFYKNPNNLDELLQNSIKSISNDKI
jgi:hypothetical protein